jgi:hypothetical protein
MQKLVIMIDSTGRPDVFPEGWPSFLKLAEGMPGLVKETTSHLDNVLYGSFQYSLIHELYFLTREDMQAALASSVGRAAGARLQEITGGRVALFFATHTEDTAENLRRHRGGEPHEPAAP